MQASGPEHFFQTDSDLKLEREREARRARISINDSNQNHSAANMGANQQHARAAYIHQLPSKVLAMLFVEKVQEKGEHVEDDPVWAFVGESGHVARRIDLKTGKASHVYKGHTGPVTALAVTYSADTAKDEFLFTGSWDKSIRKWDVHSATCIQVLNYHSDFIKCLLLVGPRLYSGSSDRSIGVWDSKTGSQLSSWTDHTRPVEALQWLDDALYSASSDTTIRKWDPETGSVVATLEGHLTSVYGLYAIDGELWSVSADKTAKRWNLESNAADSTFEHPDFVKSLTVAGPYLVTGCRDENIRVWDLATEKCLNVIEAHLGEVSFIGIHAGLLWTASLDQSIRGWKVSDLCRPGPSSAPPSSSSSSSSSVAVAAAAEKGKVKKGSKQKQEVVMTAEEEAELAELMD